MIRFWEVIIIFLAIKGILYNREMTVERRLRPEKICIFSRIRGVRILAYIAVNIHYKKDY